MMHILKQKLKENYHRFTKNQYILKFEKMVSAENLWHFHRESVARAMALGVACSWIPLPMHTAIAVFLAIIIDCNIPLTAIAIWVANPLTMPFMYYFAYRLGASILNVYMIDFHVHLTIHDVLKVLHQIWQPFLLGCLIYALVTGLLTYLIMHMLWPSINDKFDW